MNNKITPINVGISIFLGWVFFELFIDFNNKKKLKRHLKKVISKSHDIEFQEYYSADLNNLNLEIEVMNEDEKNHAVLTYENSFEKRSSLCLDSYINKLHLYHKKRTISNSNLIFQENDFSCNYLINLEKMLWYPYFFRIIFTYQNYIDLNFFRSKFEVFEEKSNNYKIYRIKAKNSISEKNILIFIGLGGFLYPFKSVIELLIEKNYQVIIPIYGPCQASLDFNLDCHEGEFQMYIYDYIYELGIYNIEILCWSLGGMLYKGFEKYCLLFKNNYNLENHIEIKKVFLIEPLIGTRGCSDTFFCQIRNYCGTLSLMNKVTSKKYHNFNYIFSYFMHTIVGFSTCVSFGYFSTVELINKNFKEDIDYERYLFISSDDIVFNKDLDKSLIESSFDADKIYFKKGYHGGWLISNKIIPILDKLIK